MDILLQTRKASARQATPIVVVSGTVDSNTMELLLKSGAAAFVGKPFVQRKYREALRVGLGAVPVSALRAGSATPTVMEQLPLPAAQEDQFWDIGLTALESYILATVSAALLFDLYSSALEVIPVGTWLVLF